MRIKLLVGLSGPGRNADEHGVVDWPDDADAARLIAAGLAEAVDEPEPEPKVKRATKKKK